MMEWFSNLFFGNSILSSCLIISLTCAIGIFFGKLKFWGISLGISFVFFVGIFFGHFDMSLDPVIADFAQSFGLCLFVFTLGLQVGPSFFSSIRSGGLSLNIMSIAVLALNILMVLIMHQITKIPVAQMVGVMSGAVTNTPALGAAQQSLYQISGDSASSTITDMALATAVTYPFGVVGVILVVIILRGVFKSNNKEEINDNDKVDATTSPLVLGALIENSDLEGVKINELQKLTNSKIVVTRLFRDNKVIPSSASAIIHVGDNVRFIVSKADSARVIEFFGSESSIDWDSLKSELVSRKIFVTQSAVNGKTIESLKIRQNYNVNVTRVNRSGIYLLAQGDLKLFVGDRVVMIGESADVKKVEDLLGNEIKKIDEPHLVTIFSGIVLGLIVGSIPFAIPGVSVPIKMGLAGGTIIVGILMGAFGYRFKFNTYTTLSANLMLREVGIVLYLSALGIQSGGGFVETLISGGGVLWIGLGALITVIPTLIVGYFAVKVMKKDVSTVLGMLCGSMANPPALSYTAEATGKNSPAIAYATVYPLTMFLRVVTAQILVMSFI